MNSINWDFKFDPPAVFEYDVMSLKGDWRCNYCQADAVSKIALESQDGWSDYFPVCKAHEEKVIEGEI